jgi:nicotinamide riboside kinase
MLTLVPFRPKQIEEERGAEDECDGDADKDVVGRCADEAVVVDFHPRVLALDFALLVEVVWSIIIRG